MSTVELLILVSILIGLFAISGLLSIVVILNYYKEMRKYPHEVIEISHDGFVYKLGTGEILSVYKIKKRILKGYIYYIGTKDNILKYDDISGKISHGTHESEMDADRFLPGPY
jgi:hypothetical protein